MSSNLDIHINRVNEKLQLLLKQYLVLQKENEKLKQELLQQKAKEKEMILKTEQLQQRVEIAKASSSETNHDVKNELEKRINTYIKEIDQCIALLGNQ